MHLIVTEKNISAQRIAHILAGKERVAEKKDGGIPSYSYDDEVVVGLRGHVVEVDFEPGYSNWRSEVNTPRSLIDARTIKVPTEKKIVSLLQKLAKKANMITIATDFDTEGELIGKEAYELVRQANPRVKVDRARFSAITPDEISHAFSHTTEIDFALAAAGEARQIIDLVWGASLTRFISLAARRGGANILSVGRVQSPTLAMIVDREREIEAFVAETYWQLRLLTEKEQEQIEARHMTARFTERSMAERARDNTGEPLTVSEVKEGKKIDRAPSPFDTTSFIVAAARLGFSAANAMRIAEDLYMNGYISYPRTDNTVYPPTLDLKAILRDILPGGCRQDVEWVQANQRPVPTRGKKSSTDHPPIHPTGPATRSGLGEERWQIYELVLRRFLATLSPDALWMTQKVNFLAGSEPYTVTGGRLIEPGWRTVYPFSEAKEYVLPPFVVGEHLPICSVHLDEKETQPPPRFTQSRLIQRMEELGLGTKSTRHEVIQKLIARKYAEGNPLRPTLVGRAVIESLENHADTITRPAMTQTLESHMQQIKERKRTSDDVVTESRQMLNQVFDQMEPHSEEIGSEIREQTAEELTLGPCPACGTDIRIRHMRNQAQFIGCNRYPECSFNISLPMMLWGFAVRTDEICPIHQLHHVRLIKKGARPWEIGCPLCHHISTNRETMVLIPSMNPTILDSLHAHHIYSVYDLAKSSPGNISKITGLPDESAALLIREAEDVLMLLRKRSDCRKFVRHHLTPRRGRSHAAIVKKLLDAGIDDIPTLGSVEIKKLIAAGIGEKEALLLQGEAKRLSSERRMREIGIPPVSLKRYQAAGIITPEELISFHPAYTSQKTGISLETVCRHVELVAQKLNRPFPGRCSKVQLEKGRKELLSIPGLGDSALEKLYRVGIISGEALIAADPEAVSAETGIPAEKIREYQARYRSISHKT
jgi:DNA topoisomerase-1